MAYIELRQVSKHFGDVVAVDRLDLNIEQGECIAMLGPSGCGKTTTLRMVAGFEDLDDGEIRVGERCLSSKKKNFYVPPEDRNFGMVFQAFAVWPHLSIYENVAFPLRIRKLPKEEIAKRTEEALKHTNLFSVASNRPDDLSGGGKQRVALARALAIRPDVMLLDEPLSSLDPHFREEMRFEIKDLQRRFGFSILYVTHDQSEAMALSDRILVMRLGVVQQTGTPLEVYGRPSNRFVFEFIGLSSFIETALDADGMSIDGASYPWPNGVRPAEDIRADGRGVLAVRPFEIEFLDPAGGAGVPGVVTRKVFLGETIDYRIQVGGTEVRVQKTRRDPGPSVGENVKLGFPQPHWYRVGGDRDQESDVRNQIS
ncbi:MAG: ABC transporter ATP-binding protein [Candidatus Accumulibacter sp.]|nr:ABC transporter ATP-binding protein [Accumulibacter sp.]